MNKNSKENSKIFIFLFIISFLLIYLFSISTSSFYGNYYTGDSSIFIEIGKAMKDGKILYKEIFDHKGPILFFIQMIGQYICSGRLGIFLIEVLALFVTNIFLYKSATFFTTNKKSLISVLISMIFMSYFIETGNYTEEYSLPLLALCLYLVLKWLNSSNKFSKTLYKYSFIYGICFAIIAFIRLNNAAMICGICFAVTIILVREKKIKELLGCAFSFIFGIFLSCLPIFLYFYKVDAIYDMLYGTFIHNFLYINSNLNTNMSVIVRIVMAFILTSLLVFNYIKYKNNKDFTITIFFIYLSILIAVNMGIKTNHYYMLAIPLITILMPPIIDIFADMKHLLKYFLIAYVCIIYMLGCFTPQIYHKINFENIGLTSLSSFINKNIPENDKDKFLAMGLFTAPVYLYTDIHPCYKYAFMQDYLFFSNPDILEEAYDYIKARKYKIYLIC